MFYGRPLSAVIRTLVFGVFVISKFANPYQILQFRHQCLWLILDKQIGIYASKFIFLSKLSITIAAAWETIGTELTEDQYAGEPRSSREQEELSKRMRYFSQSCLARTLCYLIVSGVGTDAGALWIMTWCYLRNSMVQNILACGHEVTGDCLEKKMFAVKVIFHV